MQFRFLLSEQPQTQIAVEGVMMGKGGREGGWGPVPDSGQADHVWLWCICKHQQVVA